MCDLFGICLVGPLKRQKSKKSKHKQQQFWQRGARVKENPTLA